MRPRYFGMISTILSQAYTWPALETFFRHTPFRAEDKFLLIDNNAGSLDAARLSREYPQAQLISNPAQQSFAKNMNLILAEAAAAGADSYLLNNDLIFAAGWLDTLLIDEPWILSPVCNMQFRYTVRGLALNLSMNYEDYGGREKELAEIIAHHRSNNTTYKVVHAVPFYCVKIPLAVQQKIGVFDEGYSEAGWEDADYTLRAWEQGVPLFFAQHSFIIHFYGKSSWRADTTPELQKYEPSKSKAGEYLFRERWGDYLTDLFGYQRQDYMQQLWLAEQNALANCYSQIVRKKKPGGGAAR